MGPLGGTMLGMGRTVRAGKTAEYELVVIREQDGRLAYEAHPSGQPTATFLSTTVSETSVVFENAEHDFRSVWGTVVKVPTASRRGSKAR